MVQYVSAADLIKAANHPALNKVAAHGFTMEYRIEKLASFRGVEICVKDGDTIIATADFDDFGDDFHNQNVETDPAYQRRGIATAMYVLAELLIEKPLWNFWNGDDHQSTSGKALWAQPNRPFGPRQYQNQLGDGNGGKKEE